MRTVKNVATGKGAQIMGNHVLYEKKGYKAYIILNKPEKLNALEGEM